MIKRKDGNILGIFPIIIILFMTAIVCLVVYKVWFVIDDKGVFGDDSAADSAMQQSKNAILAFDNLTIMIFLMISLVVIVSASQLSNNPAWFFIALMVLIIAVIVGAIMSNAFEDVTNVDELNESVSQFTKTEFLMGNLPLYTMFMAFSIFISMYLGYKLM